METLDMRELIPNERYHVDLKREDFVVDKPAYKASRYRNREDEMTIRIDTESEWPLSPEVAGFQFQCV